MKKILFTLLLFITIFKSFAQDKNALEEGANRVYLNTTKGNYEALLNDTYPKLFELIPKDKMLTVLKSMLQTDAYIMDILEAPANFEFGEIKHIGKGYYCLVKYDMLSKMTFTEPLSQEEAQQMVVNLKAAMKTEDVTFNPNFNSFTIKSRADLIAINNENTNGKWTYMNRGAEKMMDKLFSPEVRAALKI